MRTVLTCCVAILWLGCSSLLAAQFGGQATPVAAAEKRLAAFEGDALTTVPERTWKTVEAAITAMRLNDVELVDRKFRGTVRLQLPPGIHTTRVGELAEGWQLLSNETRQLFGAPNGPFLFSAGTGAPQPPSASDYFRILIKRTPEDQRPAGEMLDYLKSPAANQDITFSRSGTDIYLSVLGKTSDEVESRLKAMVQLLDATVHQSSRRELLASAQVSLAKAKAHLHDQQRLEAELKAFRERAENADPIGPELLTHLQAQQITIGIEIDGLEAELKACDELLQEKQRTEQEAARTRRVYIKLEMSRQRAKLERINGLLKAEQEQANRRREKTKLSREIASAAAKVADEVRNMTTLANLIDMLAPLPAVDDAINIAPLEWVTR